MATNVFADMTDLERALDGVMVIKGDEPLVEDASALRESLIDCLVYSAVFGDADVKEVSRWLIRRVAPAVGVYPSSIHDLYMAAGQGAYSNATAPAINVRTLTYDVARTILRAARATDNKIVLFEIARSEMGYTDQRPAEYAVNVLAAAIKEGHQGPVFIQGDHFQANAKNYAADGEREIQGVRDLVAEAIVAGFYNIDIDASTLVDLSRPTLAEQQQTNYERTAELTRFIREHEPEGVTVSIGGEIGEVGSRNSTVEELQAFMGGYRPELDRLSGEAGQTLAGISKISVQTGTTHGGVPLPDGTVAEVNVDFDTLARLSQAARDEYGLGGAVQHGASTLPEEAFGRFAEANAIEVHLATAFQNLIYESAFFPEQLKAEIYAYLAANHAGERKADQTDAQFYYTTRKRGFGPFKRQLWDLPEETRAGIMGDLQPTFELIMRKLGVAGSASLVDHSIKPVDVPVQAPDALRSVSAG
ncbi:MAG TPA: class II fructose-bisphosphate aldolase [Thermomicrobiales bacterium]|nr:class II fructose-bisphosphate aldolase [Thermomicrobiales bacterium]